MSTISNRAIDDTHHSHVNDENFDPNPKMKLNNAKGISDGQTQENDEDKLSRRQHNGVRRALGVISESALNSRLKDGRVATNELQDGLETTADARARSRKLKKMQARQKMEEEDEYEGETTLTISSSNNSQSGDNTNTPMSPVMNERVYEEIARAYRKYSRDTLDPDDEDTYDITMVAEYGNQIFNYLHKLEIKFAPDPHYMDKIQTELMWDHRSTLMDWLVQLHSRFNLLPETLYLAVNLIDRFLSKQAISLSRFQLCGAVALFIAAKYEEINVPTVSQMIYMVGNQFTRDEFLKAERFMVEALDFEFGYPGPMSFLRRGSKADDYDSEIRTLAKYFLEITIMDARFVASPASWLAAGAQYTSRKMLGRGGWTDAHIYYTGYTAEQLDPLYVIFVDCCLRYKTHHLSIFDKYSERRFRRSSIYVQEYLETYYSDK